MLSILVSVCPQTGLKSGLLDRVLVWGILLDIGLNQIGLKILHMMFAIKPYAVDYYSNISCSAIHFFRYLYFVIP